MFRECKIKWSGPSKELKSVYSDNLGLRIVDRLRKLGKVDFSMEFFADSF